MSQLFCVNCGYAESYEFPTGAGVIECPNRKCREPILWTGRGKVGDDPDLLLAFTSWHRLSVAERKKWLLVRPSTEPTGR